MNDAKEGSLRELISGMGYPQLMDVVERAKITTLDGLFTELSAPVSALPSDVIPILKQGLVERFAAPGVCAQDEIEAMSRRELNPGLGTGIEPLDVILSGSGFSTHTVAEISGVTGAGKTVSGCYNRSPPSA